MKEMISYEEQRSITDKSKENRTNKSKGNLFRQIIEEKVSRKSEFFRYQEDGPMA